MVGGVDWADAWLLGAALSPTDPVFAAALIGNDAVPARLRHLLNVESGLNDGLAVPFVVAALGYHGAGGASVWSAAGEAALGAALGTALAWVGVKASRASTFFNVAEDHVSIGAFAIALLVLSTSALTHANEFLAAFAAGVTVSRMSDRVMPAFEPLGRPTAEMLKLAALLLFGALLTVGMFTSLGWRSYLFAVATVLVARPVSIALAMLGARLSRTETLVAGWFGPRGFASVFFGFLVLHAGIENAQGVFALLALVVVMSIVAHSSTDVLVARRFERTSPQS
ncbi:MAG TPA: cation:proton antiporter [Vicinamibacterales bacterium]